MVAILHSVPSRSNEMYCTSQYSTGVLLKSWKQVLLVRNPHHFSSFFSFIGQCRDGSFSEKQPVSLCCVHTGCWLEAGGLVVRLADKRNGLWMDHDTKLPWPLICDHPNSLTP